MTASRGPPRRPPAPARGAVSALGSALGRAWQEGGALATLLAPLAGLHGALAAARRAAYRAGWLAVEPSSLPVVVVGNLSVGGTGKTPLTAHLVAALARRGRRPGIVGRGYGGRRRETPHLVAADDPAVEVGDEPLLLRRLTGVPVAVCARRARAVALLARESDCDVVVADDGLGHLAMARAAEIVVVDEATGFGNGRLLPAGPLRERPRRLYAADLVALRRADIPDGDAAASAALVAVTGAGELDPERLPPAFGFALGAPRLRRWPDGEWRALAELPERSVHALAGIARPERFFDMLAAQGLDVTAHPLPDHHAFVAADLAFDDARPVLVTAKDAVKLEPEWVRGRVVYEVGVDVVTDAAFEALVDSLERRLGRTAPPGRTAPGRTAPGRTAAGGPTPSLKRTAPNGRSREKNDREKDDRATAPRSGPGGPERSGSGFEVPDEREDSDFSEEGRTTCGGPTRGPTR